MGFFMKKCFLIVFFFVFVSTSFAMDSGNNNNTNNVKSDEISFDDLKSVVTEIDKQQQKLLQQKKLHRQAKLDRKKIFSTAVESNDAIKAFMQKAIKGRGLQREQLQRMQRQLVIMEKRLSNQRRLVNTAKRRLSFPA
jgi:hypothetical protein